MLTYVSKTAIICHKPGKTPVDNFLAGVFCMTESGNDKIFKIRFRFPNGEEFEAEGNREFIEQQRNYFLALIGKQRTPSVISAEPSARRTGFIRQPLPPTSSKMPSAAAIPAQAPHSHTPQTDLSLPPAERGDISPSAANSAFPALRLWERILKEDGDIVVLRKKTHLSAQEGALLLIAGTRVLLKQPACTALNLSRALKKSGFDGGRLDRLLAPDIKNGHITSDGSKRSRTYRLSNEGFARSFVLAEKLGEEIF